MKISIKNDEITFVPQILITLTPKQTCALLRRLTNGNVITKTHKSRGGWTVVNLLNKKTGSTTKLVWQRDRYWERVH